MGHSSSVRNDGGWDREVYRKNVFSKMISSLTSSFRAVVRAGVRENIRMKCEKESRNLPDKWI